MRYSLILPLARDGDAERALVDRLTQAVANEPGGECVVVRYSEGESSYAAAANDGARRAGGEVLVFVRDAVPASARVLLPLVDALASPGTGIAGTMLLAPAGTVDESGTALRPARLSFEGFAIYRPTRSLTDPDTGPLPCDAVTLGALATPRALFLELGGFDATLGDAYDALDYCLRARERALGTVVVPAVRWTRTRAAQGTEEARRRFGARWRERFTPQANLHAANSGYVCREEASSEGLRLVWVPLGSATVVVHGPEPLDRQAFEARVRRSNLQPAAILWAGNDVRAAAAATEVRSNGYAVFVRSGSQLEPAWLDALVDAVEYAGDRVTASIDGATIVALRLIPQHIRLREDLPFDAALDDWLARANAARTLSAQAAEQMFASIVLLNWNTAHFTELAVNSIREHTRVPHEIIIVENGSQPDDAARIANLHGVRVIANAKNTGFAYGSNQGMAAARGTHIVILNNDVIVTEGWLEALLDLQRRNPAIRVTAPRSNNVVGPQKLDSVPYQTIPALHAFAARRSLEFRNQFSIVRRVIGFCMCIDRRVVDEVGGFDPRYGLGNFEDDDLCLRIRAAGYEIAVCEDSFVHHFGSASFSANKLNYDELLRENFRAFLRRWDLSDEHMDRAQFDSLPATRRGFVRATDFVPLPPPEPIGADWQLGSWR